MTATSSGAPTQSASNPSGPHASRGKDEPSPPRPVTAAPIPERVKGRRRPALIGLGVALVAVFGLAGAFLATAGRDTHAVIVVAADVPAGAQIQASDLTTTNMTRTAGLRAVPAEDLDAVIGMHASGPLSAGSLLNPAMVAERLEPADGEAIIGIGLTPSQLPATGLQGGDQVTLIVTWTNQGGLEGAPAPGESSWQATVVAVGPSNDDQTRTVDFSLSSDDARAAAAAAGLGSIAVVLDRAVAGE